MSLSVVILAAGQGTRMRSALPKVLHPVGGRPMLAHVIDAAAALTPQEIVVVHGHGGDAVREALGDHSARWVEQTEQLGTGHAAAQALEHIDDRQTVLVLCGDVPLIAPRTLGRLTDAAGPQSVGLLTVHLEDPTGYGRIVRDDAGEVRRIVEEKDATPVQRRITEIHTGMLAAPAGRLRRWVAGLDRANAQGEIYLTDVIASAVTEGWRVCTVVPGQRSEVMGVNDRVQLAEVERRYQYRQAEALMRDGVTLKDPYRFELRGTLEAGRDVVIDVGVVIEGRVRLGEGVVVGPYSVLRDTELGEGVRIEPHCLVDGARIGAASRIGPFARVRPGTALDRQVHIGNFVEIKQAEVGEGSKINHLSYVGDATVGKHVNIGAGTITCNYDGANKHRTVIGDAAFIGSDTQLVAPVSVGAGATIGAGSTITRDAPGGELTLSRVKQETRAGWQRPQKRDKGD